jgi:hypothetical protein
MRSEHGDHDDQPFASETILFPINPAANPHYGERSDDDRRFTLTGLTESAGNVLTAIETMSRRIDDLARELRCLGHFDDDDRPRAA